MSVADASGKTNPGENSNKRASLAKNTALNLLGSVIPGLISLITVPFYLRLVGPERFGVLSIAWVLLGFFGLFDLGLGAATSFRIAGQRDATAAQRARTFWTALTVNLGLGVVGGAALWLGAHEFFKYAFKVSEHLRLEILAAVPLLAAAVPIATVSGVLYGALQGRERFLSTNMFSVISTLLFQILPILTALVAGPGMPLLLGTAVLARGLSLLFLLYTCYVELGRYSRPVVDRGEIHSLLSYGAWVTIASLAAPILVFADRFAIGAILGAVAVAAYTVPFQLSQRINMIPSSLMSALFPRFVPASAAEHDRIGGIATLTIASILTVPVLVAIVALRPFLNVWVGADLASKAAPVGRILLVGFWINAFAYVPQMRLQASGRPRLVALVYMLQLPPYLAALYVGMTYFGLEGCAFVLCVRNIADWLSLAWGADRSFKGWRILALDLALLALGVWLVDTPSAGIGQNLGLAALAITTVAISWRFLPGESKALLYSLLVRVRHTVLRAQLSSRS